MGDEGAAVGKVDIIGIVEEPLQAVASAYAARSRRRMRVTPL